jgi:hypothetical protein
MKNVNFVNLLGRSPFAYAQARAIPGVFMTAGRERPALVAREASFFDD